VIVIGSRPSARGGGWCAKSSGTGDEWRVGTSLTDANLVYQIALRLYLKRVDGPSGPAGAGEWAHQLR
jgi:hypothetical protein